MPKSKLRTNRQVVAMGSNLGQRRLTRGDVKIKEAAYNEKVETYSKLSLDDCKEMYTEGCLGGIYKDALLTVIKNKTNEVKSKKDITV